ncbi:MAG: hypothetical protein EOO20_19485 [Chryseobacterium sp.]|nr:MAG: hypothetical protein EOO20_19485 [Chryseobacterium sp.]
MKKTFKVLSIDGGGMKGLYSATILHKVEQELIRETGNQNARIVDYFDLICGTSTGGLIALALSLGISTKKICEFYSVHGPKIFKKPIRPIGFLRQTLFFGKYSDKNLRGALEGILGKNKIKDSRCLLCIPTYDFSHGTYEIFKYDHPEGNLNRDNELLMVDVALATSAAPTYFPIAEVAAHANRQYVDGGVWANNPSLIGYAEGIRHFAGGDKQYDDIELLSISSLNIASKQKPFSRRQRSFAGWRSKLFEMSMIAQSEFAHIFLESLKTASQTPLRYLRISSPSVQSVHVAHIDLDKASKKSLTLMEQFGNDEYHKYKAQLKTFFEHKKTYQTKRR